MNDEKYIFINLSTNFIYHSEPLSHASKITMQCSNPLLPAYEGDNATFNCTVIFGVGSFQTAEVTIEWGRVCLFK